MPLVQRDSFADSAEDRFIAAQTRQWDPSADPTRLDFGLQQAQESDGFSLDIGHSEAGRLVGANFRRGSLIGAAIERSVAGMESAGSIHGNRVDPAFNPYGLLTDEFLAQHPYMADEFQSGDVLDIPNAEAFHRYVRHKGEDAADREIMGRHGFAANLAAGLVAQGPEIMATYGAGSPFAFARATRAGFAARLAANAGEAAALNFTQEEMIRALAPTKRNVDETQAGLMALGMGAAFGSAMPLLARGGGAALGKGAQWLNEARLRQMPGETAAALNAPAFHDVLAAAADSDAMMADLLAKNATPDRPLSVLVTEKNAADLLELRNRGFDFIEHPRQADYDMAARASAMDKETASLAATSAAGYTTVMPGSGPKPTGGAFGASGRAVVDQMTPAERAQYLQGGAGQELPAAAGASGKVADIMSSAPGVPQGLAIPGGRLRKAYSSVGRKVSNLLFDNSWATRESASTPLSHEVTPPAEALKWNLDALKDRASLDMRAAYREGVKGGAFDHVMGNGETVRVKRGWLSGGETNFGRAVYDHMAREDAAARGHGQAPQSHPAVVRAAAAARKYFNAMGKEGVELELIGSIDNYTPRRWKGWQVLAKQDEFIERLIEQQRRNHLVEFNGGKVRTPAARLVEQDAITGSRGKGLTKDDVHVIEAHLQQSGRQWKDFTEGELGGLIGSEGMARYGRELEAMWKGRAESTRDTLIGADKHFGIEELVPRSSPMKSRQMEIDPQMFRDFLHDDVGMLLEGYHHGMSGQMASRRAFRMDGEAQQLVKDLLGVDPKESGYDPTLLIEATKKHYAEWMRLAENQGDEKLRVKIEGDMQQTLRYLTEKMQQLHGAGMQDMPIGMSLLAQRVARRMPIMAYLGNMAVSNIPDLASVALTSKMTARQQHEMVRMVATLKGAPRDILEATYVGSMDAANGLRAAKGMDIADMPTGREYGPGTKGKVMEIVDKGTEKATGKFVQLTGMRWLVSTHRRVTGHMVMADLQRFARQMVKADDLRASGMDQAQAVAKTGLSESDAALMNRLGFNASKSRKLVRMLQDHGTDIEGNPIADVNSFDGFIHPQIERWVQLDPDLARTFQAAINRHTLDLAVEPKLLSKPLVNQSFHGQLFNQMANFFYAWGNQQAVLASQSPATRQAMYLMMAVGLGGVADAAHNAITGRRGLDETASRWKDKPLSMMYGAVDRSAVLGWLSRPIAMANQAGVGPNRIFNNDQLSGTFSRGQDPWATAGGPFASWMASLYKGGRGALNGDFGPATQRALWQAAPYHNLLWINAGLRALDAAGYDTPEFTQYRK